MHSSAVVAIVDAYSSGSQLAREFNARGHRCVMVQSAEQIPPNYRSSFRPEFFQSVIIHHGDLDATKAELRKAKVNLVVPGCEMGVELSDQLSERLGLITNGTKHSQARRNKALMVEAFREHDLPTPHSIESMDWDSISKWLREHDKWPVVLKPLRSSGSDGVAICQNESEVRSGYHLIRESEDVFGNENQGVLVQEHVEGAEYAVDTVSCKGRHKVVAIWKYVKNLPADRFSGTDSMELLSYSPSLTSQLSPIVFRALDALAIQIGPAHSELIWTVDGPVLIEVGARLNGGNNPLLSRYCGGESQIDCMIDAYLDPDRFLGRLHEPCTFAKSAMRVFLIPRPPGTLKASPDWTPIEQLESFYELAFTAKPGRRLSRIAGSVVLVHEDSRVLHRDRDRIRLLEDQGLYPLESPAGV